MIPRVIHYCWFGDRSPDAELERCMATWRTVMPDFEVHAWTEHNTPLDNDYCRYARAQGQWSRLSNYVRLRALDEHGGVYLDTDVEVLRPLDPLLDAGAGVVLGFQRREEVPGWVNGAVFAAQPGHPFLGECLELTEAAFRDRGELMMGPHVVTQVLRRRGLATYGAQRLGDIDLHPIETFYPYNWLETYRPECVTEQTYAVHHWRHSWA